MSVGRKCQTQCDPNVSPKKKFDLHVYTRLETEILNRVRGSQICVPCPGLLRKRSRPQISLDRMFQKPRVCTRARTWRRSFKRRQQLATLRALTFLKFNR